MRVACEEEVHEFFEHVTEITDPDCGLGNCCNRLFVASAIPDFSGRTYYLLVCGKPTGGKAQGNRKKVVSIEAGPIVAFLFY